MNKAAYRLAILIPFYNHFEALTKTLDALPFDVPVLIVNDGSERTQVQLLLQHLEGLAGRSIELIHHEQNAGKGAAVKTGVRWLFNQGYTHAMQVDADGQHELGKIKSFVELSQKYPQLMVCGAPIFSEDMPKARFYGRYATHVWVWINTLSFHIKDSMCGFRLYPLNTIHQLLQRHGCGDRMDFDVELLVRAYWAHIPMKFLPIKVSYPEDGVSHFQPLQDNLLISSMHTRLFFGMLIRLPKLLFRKLKQSIIQEQGYE